MTINLSNLSKRYNRDWIFRNLNYNFRCNKKYAIAGPNGSGKSTLLLIISGATTHNEGGITYIENNKPVAAEKIYNNISFCAPYLELIEEMTLVEFFNFHRKMKGWLPGIESKYIIKQSGLEKASHKQIRYYSSGMKQRVKLAQAIFSNAPILLLDEPLTNLDTEGFELYKLLIKNYSADRLVIISSNDYKEYSFCDEVIDISNFK